MKIASCVAPVGLLLLAACNTIPSAQSALHGKQLAGVNYVDFPSERRGAWIVDGTQAGNFRICAEPFSDTGISTQQLISLTAKLPKAKADATGSLNTVSNLVELKGRTPAVLAMRDVMYRMCERRMSSPGGTIPPEELYIFSEIVKIIGEFAHADRADAEAKQARVEVSTGLESNSALAGVAQSTAFDLLGTCDWRGAQRYFEKAEAILPGYQVAYEYGKALRNSAAGQEKDAVVGIDSDYMPTGTKRLLARCN